MDLRALVVALALTACASRPSGQPDAFDSERLVIQAGGMRMVDGRPVVSVALKNATEAPVWVEAHFASPMEGEDCRLSERLDPGSSHSFACPQSDLIFDAVYTVSFDVFGDAGRSVLLEQQSTELLFGSEFRALLEISRKAQEAERKAELEAQESGEPADAGPVRR